MLQVKNGSLPKVILKQLRAVHRNDQHTQLNASLHLLRHDLRETLQHLSVPSLHFYAEMDQLVPRQLQHILPAMSDKISSLGVPAAGHLAFISDPQWLADELVKFTRRIDAGSC